MNLESQSNVYQVIETGLIVLNVNYIICSGYVFYDSLSGIVAVRTCSLEAHNEYTMSHVQPLELKSIYEIRVI